MTRILCWVEGTADRRFVSRWLEVWGVPWDKEFRFWNQEESRRVNHIIENSAASERPVLLLADSAESSSTTSRRNELLTRFPDLAQEDLFIVNPEIEAWYLAGLKLSELKNYGDFTDQQCSNIKKILSDGTNSVRRKRFLELIPRTYQRIPITVDRWETQMLERFDWEQAKTRNSSFSDACQQLTEWCNRWGITL